MKSYFFKLSFSCTFLMLAFQAMAQVPQKMSYQAVIRNASNNLVTNSPVGLRFSILQDSSTGPAVYVETHRPTTNINGLASVEIGAGTVVSGTFATINWSTGKYFLKTDTDPNGGTSYTISGTTQFLTVPYAFVADRVLNPSGNNGFNTAVKVTNIISGTYGCRAGGYRLQFGLDSNRNGILDNAEIITSLTRNVCNGAQGAQGPQGVGITSTVDNLNGTFTLFYSDGSSYTTSSLIGPAGASGVGISSTTDNGNGTFTLNYSDGTSFTTSNLTGPAGAQGATGPQGPTGQTGAQGAAGVGIVSTVNNGNGTYTFNYSDGSSFTTSNLTGPAGSQGATGPQGPIGLTGATGPQGPIGQTGATGPQGPSGTNGVSVTNSFVQGDSLYVVLSNGQTLNTGYVRGPQGPAGANGVSVTNSYIQNDSLYFTLSNGTTLNTGSLQGNTSTNNPQVTNNPTGNSSIVSGISLPGFLNYFGDCSNGNKVCVNNEVLVNNSKFCNLTIPIGVTAKVNPSVTTIIYVDDTLFLYGTINGSGLNAATYSMNNPTNHIGATSSGYEVRDLCSITPAGGNNLSFSWIAAQQPSSYYESFGGTITINSGVNNSVGTSCGTQLCTSQNGQNLSISDLLKILHFGIDISGVNGAGIANIDFNCNATTYGGQGGAGLYLIARNVVFNGSIVLNGGNGQFYTCSNNYYTAGGGGAGSCILRTDKILSNIGTFTSNGGSQTASYGCNRRGGNGSMIIVLP